MRASIAALFSAGLSFLFGGGDSLALSSETPGCSVRLRLRPACCLRVRSCCADRWSINFCADLLVTGTGHANNWETYSAASVEV